MKLKKKLFVASLTHITLDYNRVLQGETEEGYILNSCKREQYQIIWSLQGVWLLSINWDTVLQRIYGLSDLFTGYDFIDKIFLTMRKVICEKKKKMWLDH